MTSVFSSEKVSWFILPQETSASQQVCSATWMVFRFSPDFDMMISSAKAWILTPVGMFILRASSTMMFHKKRRKDTSLRVAFGYVFGVCMFVHL